MQDANHERRTPRIAEFGECDRKTATLNNASTLHMRSAPENNEAPRPIFCFRYS